MRKYVLLIFLLFCFASVIVAQCPVSVNISSVPDVTTGKVCKSTPVQLTASPSIGALTPQYLWIVDGDTIVGADSIINVLAENQTVELIMLTTTGCSPTSDDSAYTSLTVQTVIMQSTVTPQPACDLTKADIQITSTGGTSPYSYDLVGIGVSNTGTYSDVPTGNYTLYIKDNQGCNDTNQIEVIPVPKDLKSTVTPLITECNQTTADVIISTTGGTAPYNYDFQGVGQNNTGSFSSVPAGEYNLYITDSDGCTDTNTVTIEHFKCPPPNPSEVMTPNEDGYNDTWYIHNLQFYPHNEVFIFDRWGQRVYHKNDYDNKDGWDAKYIGANMPVSTYYYVLKIYNENSDDEVYKGPISIFR